MIFRLGAIALVAGVVATMRCGAGPPAQTGPLCSLDLGLGSTVRICRVSSLIVSNIEFIGVWRTLRMNVLRPYTLKP